MKKKNKKSNNKVFRWKQETLTRHDLIANNKHIFRPILERSQDLDLIFDNEIQPENGDRVLLLLHIAFQNISFI